MRFCAVMRRDSCSDTPQHNNSIPYVCQRWKTEEATRVLDMMISRGHKPSQELVNTVLDTCIRGKNAGKVSCCFGLRTEDYFSSSAEKRLPNF